MRLGAVAAAAVAAAASTRRRLADRTTSSISLSTISPQVLVGAARGHREVDPPVDRRDRRAPVVDLLAREHLRRAREAVALGVVDRSPTSRPRRSPGSVGARSSRPGAWASPSAASCRCGERYGPGMAGRYRRITGPVSAPPRRGVHGQPDALQQQLADAAGVGLPAGRLHDRTDDRADRAEVARPDLLGDVRLGGQRGVDGLEQRTVVGHDLQAARDDAPSSGSPSPASTPSSTWRASLSLIRPSSTSFCSCPICVGVTGRLGQLDLLLLGGAGQLAHPPLARGGRARARGDRGLDELDGAGVDDVAHLGVGVLPLAPAAGGVARPAARAGRRGSPRPTRGPGRSGPGRAPGSTGSPRRPTSRGRTRWCRCPRASGASPG